MRPRPICGRRRRADPGGAALTIRDRGERMAVATQTAPAQRESFAALLNESMGVANSLEGTVVKGRVISIENDAALIDVGLKSEGRVPLKEFAAGGSDEPEIHVGDIVEVFLERMEDKNGEASLSREKARREEAWTQLEKSFQANERVTGVIFGRVKGGFTVDLNGAVAFLPGSQVDIRPVRDIGPLLGSPQPFQILKMDRSRGNIVVSRRAVLEESRAEQRSELVASLKEGQILKGRVTNITDYGAFVELEPGVEGLVHVSEMSWTKKNVHPGKIVSTSQEVEVQILEVDAVKRRISLGLKQTMRNPWELFIEKYPAGTTVEGEVKNKTEFGLFLGLDGDVDGMVHLSDLDWKRPGEQVIDEYKKGDQVKAKVLDVDVEKERISLGIKQLEGDPMDTAGDLKKGSVVTCEVTEVKEGGIDVKIVGSDLTTFIKRSELARDRGEQRPERFAVGQKVDGRIIQFDRRAHKVQVSIKALEVAEEKEAIAQYGSSDSGATLGDILGHALKRKGEKPAEKK